MKQGHVPLLYAFSSQIKTHPPASYKKQLLPYDLCKILHIPQNGWPVSGSSAWFLGFLGLMLLASSHRAMPKHPGAHADRPCRFTPPDADRPRWRGGTSGGLRQVILPGSQGGAPSPLEHPVPKYYRCRESQWFRRLKP